MARILKDIFEFRDLVVAAAARQLRFDLPACGFSFGRVPHDHKRFNLAIEFFDCNNVPLRLRVYIRNSPKGFQIGQFRLYEDPDKQPGPEDEVYVSETDMDGGMITMLSGYFSKKLDLNLGAYYNALLTNDGEVMLTNNGDFLLY